LALTPGFISPYSAPIETAFTAFLSKETRIYLKISSSSWKTEEISSKGALKLEVPKMPKVMVSLAQRRRLRRVALHLF
jgi:hypothetical protein